MKKQIQSYMHFLGNDPIYGISTVWYTELKKIAIISKISTRVETVLTRVGM